MEIAILVNRAVVERFVYCPPLRTRSDDDADVSEAASPYSRLCVLYGSDCSDKAALLRHLELLQGKTIADAVSLSSPIFSSEQSTLKEDLAQAKGGQVCARFAELLTWRDIFDTYASCRAHVIFDEGLVLLVVDLMTAAALPLHDDEIKHRVYLLSCELRAAGLTSNGVCFEHFLLYAVANKDHESFALLYQHKQSQAAAKVAAGSTSHGTSGPSFELEVWVGGGKGGGVGVEEVVCVEAPETCQKTQQVVLRSDKTAKAKWLSRCMRIALDSIASMLRGTPLQKLPDIMTMRCDKLSPQDEPASKPKMLPTCNGSKFAGSGSKTVKKYRRAAAAPVAARTPATSLLAPSALETPPQTSTQTCKEVPAELTAFFATLASPLVGVCMDVSAREWLEHLRGTCSQEHSPCDASTNAFSAAPHGQIPLVSRATRSALKPIGEDTEVKSDMKTDVNNEVCDNAGSDGSSDVPVGSIFFFFFLRSW